MIQIRVCVNKVGIRNDFTLQILVSNNPVNLGFE